MRKSIKNILMNDIVTIHEAAKLMGLAPGTIKTKVVRRNLDAIKKGKTWLLDIKDLKKKEVGNE